MKILITGLSGLIGEEVRRTLQDEHELTAYNRSDVPGVNTVCADLSDFAALKRASQDQDVVIHLAAKAGEDYRWEELRDTNVEGTRHVFAAATGAGVPRIVFASSGATVAGHESDEPYKAMIEGRYESVPARWPMISVHAPTRPRGVYGASKVWGEALARHFADTTASTFLNIRIGYVNAEDKPRGPRQQSVWCSHRDVVNAIQRAALTPVDTNYATFFAGSNNRYNYRDLSDGAALCGFVPQDGVD